jgi:hypothetical protein
LEPARAVAGVRGVLPTFALVVGLIVVPGLRPLRADDALAVDSPARGPSEIRDEHLLAQPRLTLPAIAPVTAPAGRWTIRIASLWSSSFGWSQNLSGENPGIRRYLIDGDSFTLETTLRRGLTRALDVAVRVPLRWRGAGVLDEPIDFWHRLTRLPDNHRPDFRSNAFRVEGMTIDRGSFSWNQRSGPGLGDVELETRWRAVDGRRHAGSLALVGRVSLPTATSPFSGQGPGAGAQLVIAAPLASAFDLYAGVGGTVQTAAVVSGIRYEPARLHGFLAIEWRAWRRLSLVVETNAASRLVTNVVDYPSLHWLLNVGGRLDLGRTRIDLGVTEGIASQDATTDVAFFLAFGLRP